MLDLTICTPTYNRGYILNKLYDSLCRQTNKSFEWLIIDDGSTDNTEMIIDKWCKEKKIVIRYYSQANSGKHRALNRGINLSNGKWFFIVDSDDCLTDNAIDTILLWIENISDDSIVAVSGLKASFTYNVCGGNVKFEGEYVDASNLDRKKFGLLGDKAEIYKTKILRKYMFPEFPDENFITEAVVWNAIAADGYKIRWFNKIIYLCEYLDDGLTKKGSNSRIGHIKNYQGFSYYVRQSYRLYSLYDFIPLFWEYHRASTKRKMSMLMSANNIELSIIKYITFLVIGVPFVGTIKLLDKWCNMIFDKFTIKK